MANLPSDWLSKMEAKCGPLLGGLKAIWDEVGVSELEKECLEIYRRVIERANRSRVQLWQTVADCEVELATICSALGERPVPLSQNTGTLKERLNITISQLEEIKNEKSERKKQFLEVLEQIQKVSIEIGHPYHYSSKMAIDESDLSKRKLQDLDRQLQSLQKEKSDRHKLVLDHLNELETLCAVLGLNVKQTTHEVHPGLDKTQVSNVSNVTIEKLASAIKSLRAVKIERLQKLQGLVGNMLKLKNLMGTQVVEQQKFHYAICNIAASEHEITEPNSLSADFINDVASEIFKLEELKASKMKELVLKKKELEELRRQTPLVEDEDEGSEIEGVVDPFLVLEKIESQISATKGEALSRKDILESLEKLLVACEEESWLEDYNMDEAGRVANFELQRAENARAVVNMIPAMAEDLVSKITAWERERGIEFTYDSVGLLSTVEKNIILRQEKEQVRERQRVARNEELASPTEKHKKDPIRSTPPKWEVIPSPKEADNEPSERPVQDPITGTSSALASELLVSTSGLRRVEIQEKPASNTEKPEKNRIQSTPLTRDGKSMESEEASSTTNLLDLPLTGGEDVRQGLNQHVSGKEVIQQAPIDVPAMDSEIVRADMNQYNHGESVALYVPFEGPHSPLLGRRGTHGLRNEEEVGNRLKIHWLRVLFTSLVIILVLQFVIVDLFMTVGKSLPLEFVALFCGCGLVSRSIGGVTSGIISKQEIVVVRTVIVTACSIIFGGGFTFFLIEDEISHGKENLLWHKKFSVWKMTGFLLILGYLGLFWVLNFKEIFHITKQPHPEQTQSIVCLVNFLHGSNGNEDRSRTMRQGKWCFWIASVVSFSWSLFGWFFTNEPNCGFAFIPTFGRFLFGEKLYFDFAFTNIGYGIITPPTTSLTILAGAFLSWHVMWPHIARKVDGVQAYADEDLRGLQGYRVFFFIAINIADAGFEVLKTVVLFIKSQYVSRNAIVSEFDVVRDEMGGEDDQIFGNTSWYHRLFFFILFGGLTIFMIPKVFPTLNYFHVLFFYVASAALSAFSAYARRISDISFFASSGPIAFLILAAFIGSMWGGVFIGLSSCGIVMCIVMTTLNFLLDYSLGSLSRTPLWLIVIGQILGIFIGSILSPLTYLLFIDVFPVGKQSARYSPPYNSFFKGMEILVSSGTGILPPYCFKFSIIWCIATIAIKLIREFLLYKNCGRLLHIIPDPIILCTLFVAGGQFAVGLCMGYILMLVFRKAWPNMTYIQIPAIAWGMILGERIWSCPAAALSLMGVHPPWCLKI